MCVWNPWTWWYLSLGIHSPSSWKEAGGRSRLQGQEKSRVLVSLNRIYWVKIWVYKEEFIPPSKELFTCSEEEMREFVLTCSHRPQPFNTPQGEIRTRCSFLVQTAGPILSVIISFAPKLSRGLLGLPSCPGTLSSFWGLTPAAGRASESQ